MRLLFLSFLFVMTLVNDRSLSWQGLSNDKYFYFQLPKGYTRKDTIDNRTYKAQGNYTTFYVSRIRQRGLQSSRPSFFPNFYKGVRKTVVSTNTLIHDTLLMFRGFQANRFKYRVPTINGGKIADVTVVLMKDICYMFACTYAEVDTENSAVEREQFFSSIQSFGIAYEDQFTNYDKN